jgi:hypothetical protein
LALAPERACAWGRRGHQVVAGVAAIVVAESDPSLAFLRSHGFDLGYYANVPDLVWKKPATYQVEWTNHFMDLEIFARELKDARGKALELDRAAFEPAFPAIKREAGRAFWRVREMDERLATIAAKLRGLAAEAPKAERQKLQVEWLAIAGALGHYIGDLSQPLHCTENYDGQLTGQKGLHAFYEDTIVDQLYPAIEPEALRLARAQWRAFAAKAASRSTLELAKELAESSRAELPRLLRTDKAAGRESLKKAAAAHRSSIAKRLATGSLYLAELWRRQMGWVYDGEKFYNFEARPEYVYAPGDGPGGATGRAAGEAPGNAKAKAEPGSL